MSNIDPGLRANICKKKNKNDLKMKVLKLILQSLIKANFLLKKTFFEGIVHLFFIILNTQN